MDPKANRARTLTTRGGKSIDVVDATTGKSISIEAPTGATINAPTWSPDGKEIAFFANFDDATHLYVADMASGKARRVSTSALLATWVTEPQWTGNGSQIAVVVPRGSTAFSNSMGVTMELSTCTCVSISPGTAKRPAASTSRTADRGSPVLVSPGRDGSATVYLSGVPSISHCLASFS